jgi:hypothetical protein
VLLGFRPESAHKIDDQADQQNQAESAATDCGAPEVETAAAEQKKKDQYEENQIHGCKVAHRSHRTYGAFPY